ncbi:MAG: rpsQ [Thermoleophilia bacterium]|nr:rpsQ [Thermoleophilia bacterium]
MTHNNHQNPEVKAPIVREFVGVVTSDATNKTITVRVDRQKLHPRYKKVMRLSKKLHAHDEANDAHTGDKVRVVACRPMSKTKTWRLVEVLERAK